MGKKKDKAGKAGKIPKQVAGVKLPKQLRRKGEALIAKAASPEGRAAIAKGLTVAASLATMAAERSRKAQAAAKPQAAASPANDPAPPQPIDPDKVAEAVSTVADAVLGRLFGGKKA